MPILKKNMNPRTLAVDLPLAKKVGAVAVLTIRASIATLGTPPNAPYTKSRKSGSNPLVDSRQLLKAAKAKIRT